MSYRNPSWERNLIMRAYEGLQGHEVPRGDTAPGRTGGDADLLAWAYGTCDRLTRVHSRTFFLASALLPPDKRQAVRALYGFCRVTDDLVDKVDGDTRLDLDAWRRRALSDSPPTDDPIAIAWADTRARYRIPDAYALQLIEGVSRDLDVVRYENFDALAAYCYGVASTVGLMAMHIIGFSGPGAIPYAVKLGVALQLTNILRDVAEDWRMGRLYLPRDELVTFGLGEDDIAQGRCDARWQTYLRFQLQRNRRIYREAIPGIALLHPDGRLAILAAAELYRAILDDIEAHDGDVYTRRAHLTGREKLARLPGIWWRARHLRPPPVSPDETSPVPQQREVRAVGSELE